MSKRCVCCSASIVSTSEVSSRFITTDDKKRRCKRRAFPTSIQSTPNNAATYSSEQGGEEALNYITNEVKNKGASIYEVKNGSDEKVDAHFQEMFNSSDQKPSEGKYSNTDNAKVIDQYNLLDNNCTTKTTEAVKVGTDGKVNITSKGPANLDTKLYYENQKKNSHVKQKQLKDIYDEYEK